MTARPPEHEAQDHQRRQPGVLCAVDDGIIARNPLAKPPGSQRPMVKKPDPVKTEAVPWTAGQVAAVASELAVTIQRRDRAA